MSIKKKWEIYYTQDEVDKMLSNSIEKNAKDLTIEFK